MLIYIGRLAVSLLFLSYASIQDVKTREVQDKVWLISVPLCIFLDCLDWSQGNIELIHLLISLGLSLAIGLSLCFLGFYGGADAKALALISSGWPSYLSQKSLLTKILPVPVIMTFISSTLLSALFPISILILNLIDYIKGKNLLEGLEIGNVFQKLILYTLARRVKLEALKGKLKYFPSEKVIIEEGKKKRKPIYYLHAEADIDALVDQLYEHQELYNKGVLASPTIPMIVFLLIGFIVSNILQVIG